MDRLKRMGSKLLLRKDKDMSIRRPELIFEDSLEPNYDCVYDRPEKFRSTRETKPFNNDMGGGTISKSKRVPGAPPEIWQEWTAPMGYETSQSFLRPRSPTQHRPESHIPTSQQSPYADFQVPLFGPQYGIPATNVSDDFWDPVPTTVMRLGALNPYEDMMRQADADMQKAFLESLGATEKSPNGMKDLIDASQQPLPSLLKPPKPPIVQAEQNKQPNLPFMIPEGHPTSCVICVEDFSTSRQPPSWISLTCEHQPSVCTDCVAQCIASDLDNKVWNQIKCPECDAFLIYQDIKRLADPETFARYETLSFRSAVSTDENFVWCQKCSFGQLHASGASQPIVRCLSCNFRSCFRHSVPWHSRLTCEEYDAFLADPDNFTSQIDKDDEAAEAAARQQVEEDERIAREYDLQNKRAEEERQRRVHQEKLRRVKAEQEAAAEMKRKEAERVKVREEMKRRQREDAASLAKVNSTTKRCPGCRWPIEKNDGCSHMTCTQCRHEFCWKCLGDWATHSSCHR